MSIQSDDQLTPKQFIGMVIMIVIFSIITFFIGHDIATENAAKNVKTVTKFQCWAKTIPHLNMMHRIKCPRQEDICQNKLKKNI